MLKITTPLTKEIRTKLRCGEEVFLTGTIYTARDMAHKRLTRLIKQKKKIPLALKDAVIYYAGPTPRGAGRAFGSCGPTTSSRMDTFTPFLLDRGLGAMIGKGRRSSVVRKSIKKHKAVYFLAVGGAGAFLAKRIKMSELVAFKELGPEAIYRLEVRNFPLIVGIDSQGNDIFKHGEKG